MDKTTILAWAAPILTAVAALVVAIAKLAAELRQWIRPKTEHHLGRSRKGSVGS